MIPTIMNSTPSGIVRTLLKAQLLQSVPSEPYTITSIKYLGKKNVQITSSKSYAMSGLWEVYFNNIDPKDIIPKGKLLLNGTSIDGSHQIVQVNEGSIILAIPGEFNSKKEMPNGGGTAFPIGVVSLDEYIEPYNVLTNYNGEILAYEYAGSNDFIFQMGYKELHDITIQINVKTEGKVNVDLYMSLDCCNWDIVPKWTTVTIGQGESGELSPYGITSVISYRLKGNIFFRIKVTDQATGNEPSIYHILISS